MYKDGETILKNKPLTSVRIIITSGEKGGESQWASMGLITLYVFTWQMDSAQGVHFNIVLWTVHICFINFPPTYDIFYSKNV